MEKQTVEKTTTKQVIEKQTYAIGDRVEKLCAVCQEERGHVVAGVVQIRFHGACHGCPSSTMTSTVSPSGGVRSCNSEVMWFGTAVAACRRHMDVVPIDPGAPWTRVVDGPAIALALKSGNFGAPDFFLKALGATRSAGR